MVIYADVIFLLNGVIDFLLLWLTSGIRKQPTSFWRLVIASLVGGLYSILYLWPSYTWFYSLLAKLFISLIMVGIAFGFTRPVAFMRNLGVFYFTCFVCGGAMFALHYILVGQVPIEGGLFLTQTNQGVGSPVSWLMVLLGFPFVWLYTRSSFRSLQERADVHVFLTSLRIYIHDRRIECVGLVDTGNQLRDPFSHAPVVIVELSHLAPLLPDEVCQLVKQKNWEQKVTTLPLEWMVRIKPIPYRAAGNEQQMMVAIKPDCVEIKNEEQWHIVEPVVIGIDVGRLSSDGTYQAIIHPSCVQIAG